ncbi:unnamed protein product [Kuraishia capsulata CBS 1993]|uniref:Small-subunit processome Utp12 domain-containing protein n=1 Tax=Kuraishia capsulata CBS 1993 TaxID=1382522 RepID=W6MR65_9ASCO|nr:uncharacterized protein KUCA_T00003711001 [Kuraishia capsulata CBS 1993]CDK27732.1 unnamed protein product [Kuraishia capsulata CBS 1993]
MRSDFKFSNLLGSVYYRGNLVFTKDGSTLLSPVGNKVSVFDLMHNKSFTLDYEHRKNISCLALNSQGNLLISVDEDGRAILVNFRARTVLHHFNFKDRVRDIVFSPDGTHFAISCGRLIQIWKTPSLTEDRQFAPFVRHRVYAGHYSEVTSVSWSGDSRFILSTSKDMTARIFSLETEDAAAKMTLSGHRDHVVRAFFSKDQESIFTVSKDGAIFQWEYTTRPKDEDSLESKKDDDEEDMNWRITDRHYFFADTKVKCCTFHADSGVLTVGFGNGEFRLYELPSFTLIQQLAMGQNAVNTITVNSTGEWLAFGSSKLGQLLVYEWQSESYILKQQGHFDSTNAIAYSPDGARIVTAADDGKIKIWDIISGFCLATFDEHSSAVTGIAFAKRGQVMFSSSLDGSVRAWDLIRYRNFRTFTAPERIQFSCLAVDPSGEIVCAGSLDDFNIHVWSVQTSQLLDSLSGHEGPVSSLSFGTENSNVLASASWDKTIRVWDIFARSQTVEPFHVLSECLALAVRPDSKQVAASTLEGQVSFWDLESGTQVGNIDGRKDILQGRHIEDRFVSQNSSRGKHFSTICYSFDGLSLLAGGNNNSLCLYDIPNEVLLKRFTVSQNMSLNGTLELLNSKKMTDAGPIDLIDLDDDLSDFEDRKKGFSTMPGSARGDPSLRSTLPEIRVTSVSFSPTANAFAAATTEGLLIYSIDDDAMFDPIDLDMEVTPENTLEALKEKEYLTALVMSFRLNEKYLIHKVYDSILATDVELVVQQLPTIYISRLIDFIGSLLMDDPHIEFNLSWIKAIFNSHGRHIAKNKHIYASGLRAIQRFLARVAKEVVAVGERNTFNLQFLTSEPHGAVDRDEFQLMMVGEPDDSDISASDSEMDQDEDRESSAGQNLDDSEGSDQEESDDDMQDS